MTRRVLVVGGVVLDREVHGSSTRPAPDAPVPVVDVAGVRESPGGDALVVLLDSDASVRRLEGPERPAVAQGDRERVLRGLASVDAVVLFGEDDPRTALAGLRPDVWAGGGDHGTGRAQLPEGDLVRSGGGRVVLLPHLDGPSTTRLLSGSR